MQAMLVESLTESSREPDTSTAVSTSAGPAAECMVLNDSFFAPAKKCVPVFVWMVDAMEQRQRERET